MDNKGLIKSLWSKSTLMKSFMNIKQPFFIPFSITSFGIISGQSLKLLFNSFKLSPKYIDKLLLKFKNPSLPLIMYWSYYSLYIILKLQY